MEEIKLWRVEGSDDAPAAVDISTVKQTKTEELLENILVKSPDMLVEGLTLIGRQTDTKTGTPDLIGVDEDGQLIIFELKRGILTREAVAQIIDYAAYISELTESDLSDLISNNSGKDGIAKIDNFSEWYRLRFGKNSVTIAKPKMILVGLGVDDKARRMVEFLANSDVDMSLVTFHGFSDKSNTYLARQVEVIQSQQTRSSRVTKATNLQELLRRVKAAGVGQFFDEIASLLRADLKSYQWPNQSGYTYYLADFTEVGGPSNRGYVSLWIPDNSHGSVVLTVLERAILAAGDVWSEISRSWGARATPKRGDVEIKISSLDEWKTVEPDVKRLCAAILRGRELRREQQIVNEQQEGMRADQDSV